MPCLTKGVVEAEMVSLPCQAVKSFWFLRWGDICAVLVPLFILFHCYATITFPSNCKKKPCLWQAETAELPMQQKLWRSLLCYALSLHCWCQNIFSGICALENCSPLLPEQVLLPGLKRQGGHGGTHSRVCPETPLHRKRGSAVRRHTLWPCSIHDADGSMATRQLISTSA